ncbi:MAG TPA: two-component regulator propeller domain-containing protein [Bacteroidales bacterium]|nr:two-component regulator propeller domain-containing protein [Bacteroidales bacterium]
MIAHHKHINQLTLPRQNCIRNRNIRETVKSLFLIFSFLTISFCTSYSYAQFTYELDKTTRFEKMGAEEGLTSGYVYCMHQDKYGFFWIGTQYGLNLYDGYEFKVFTADPKNPESLLNSWILDILEEPNGTMWFGTYLGISKYNRANQTFINYLPDTLSFKGDHNSIKMILQDGNYLWIDVYGLGLFRFNKETERFRSFSKDTLNPSKGIYGSTTDYIFIDASGVVWVCSSETGGDFTLNRFNKKSATFSHFKNDPANPKSFVGKEVRSMVEDNEGTIWIATLGGGLLEIIDKEKGKFRQYLHDENNKNSIINNYLYKVFKDSNGNIWIAGVKGFSLLNKKTRQFTNYHVPKRSDFHDRYIFLSDIYEDNNGNLNFPCTDGFFRYNPSTKVLHHYLNAPENLSSIGDSYVKQILDDRSGQTWIIVPNSGVNRINQFSNAFRKIQKKTNVNNNLSGKGISTFLSDSKGNFWIGDAHGGGLNRSKTNNHKIYENLEHFGYDADDPKSISGNRISAMYEDHDQNLWFGTWAGLNHYDYNTNSFTRFQHDLDDSATISQNIIESVVEDSHGTLWIGTRNGLNIMDRETGKFIRFYPDDNDSTSILNHDIRVIFEDSYGELWFGGDYLERLNRKDTSFVHYLPDALDKSGTDRSVIWGIEEDDSTNLWFSSSQGGILKLNRKNMTFTELTKNDGLPSNTINAIEIDDRGVVWASSNQGLSRVDPHDYSIRNFDMGDGLVSLEFINRSSYKDADGWLCFGSRDGFNVFHPDSIKENKILPPVYITSLSVAGEPKYFDKPLYELEDIELRYNENDFSFDFVALNYINSGKNQYAYMLEGYDEDWEYVGGRRTAYYTNLSPGNYTFRVKGSNNDGYWNEEGASLELLILSPFWKTWWAYLIYALAFAGLLYLVRRNELRKLYLRQELELEHQNAENLAELDIEKNKFFSNISHEFRTPLTLILGPLDRFIGTLNNEEQKQEINLVRRNARRLQTLINQLLSLSKLESGKMKLKARPENIVKLTSLFLQSFHSMAEDKGIKLEFESDAEEHIVYIDSIKFEKVVNNLLSNAFKFTEKGGKIKVSITLLNPSLRGETHGTPNLPKGVRGVQITFSDTGIGIRKEKLPHVFDRFYQVDEQQMKTYLGTGIGLALTKELVELHHGTITVDSEAGVGTTFTVFFPLGKDHLTEDEIYLRKVSNSDAGKKISETDDDLLNDDYLFSQDVEIKTEIKTEVIENSNLPLLLIVEDNEDMRSYIKSHLVGSYNIMEATNGKEGAEKAIERIPDLIVSDLMMPELDGNEMTLQLKTDERTSHIPIILLTAKVSKESKMEGLETGADDFLTKPFDADELLVRINNLIKQRKRLREVFGKKLSYSVSPKLTDLKDSGITSMDEQFLIKAYEVAEKGMSDSEFGVSSFSGQMGLSRMQLHRKLKAITDQSATEFIKIIRLNKAAVLLKSKSATVAEIAYDTGFSSPSYFSACFKEHFGETPLEYAK